MSASVGLPAHPLARARLADFLALTKPRITLLVVLTTSVGFLAAAGSSADLVLLVHTLAGTALVAAAASALNQVAEREADAEMRRTARRPLPAGRLATGEAAVFGAALALSGALYLAAAVNPLASALAVLTAASYLLLYTPLKKVTSLATVVGAVPGAMPPMIGWAAARGTLGVEAWILFAIVFFWQMPHFLAIAAIYRHDYQRAGFRVLPVVDPAGASTGRQSALYGLALIPISLLPSFVGLAGPGYFFAALLLGIGFVLLSVRLALDPSSLGKARSLFRFSLIYLPLLWTALLVG
ncbi:MAG: protoheme IX farnesyltransferase [Gemmatimonadetes bacterium]|nr:protoheme IX farnesyltransferase [Gemmatimonadota bacterium]